MMQMFRVVVVFLVVAAVAVRSTPFSLRDLSNDCKNQLTNCFSQLAERYQGKDDMELFEEIRNTPLRTHCNEWNAAVGCARQVIKTDVCDETRSIVKNLDTILELYDWNSHYICVEHFDKVDRNFRCLVSVEVFVNIISKCSETLPLNDVCSLIEKKSEALQCSEAAVSEKCGSEASSISHDLTEKIFTYVEVMAEKDCPSSNRARQLAMLKRMLMSLY